MEIWEKVRFAYYNPADGVSPTYAELARNFDLDPRTVKKMISLPAPPGYQMKHPRPLKGLAAHLEFIEKLLVDDVGKHRKHRLTAARIYEIIKEQRKFAGSERAVRSLMAKLRHHYKEVFVPLLQPKSKAQVDFYEALVIMGGLERKSFCFNMTLSYSDAVFSMAFPFQKREAWLEGHKQAFIFFGGVPQEIVYDNDRALVSKMLSGHTRKTTEEFQRLQCFYCFKSNFCNAYRGHEKGIVENSNKYLQQHFFTPYQRVRDFHELNGNLHLWCRDYLNTTAKGKQNTRGELLDEERKDFLPLPQGEFESCITKPRMSNELSLVSFDNVRYSVPDTYAHRQDLIVKGFWDRTEVYTREGEFLAGHPRRYENHTEELDPFHYLTTLSRKPGVLDYGRSFAEFELPQCFHDLRNRLESEAEIEAAKNNPDKLRGKGGKHRGTKEFVRIVKLLLEFSLPDLTRAVAKSLRLGHPEYEVIRSYCYPEESPEVELFTLEGREHLKSYGVKKPQLINYDNLLDVGNNFEPLEEEDGQPQSAVGELSERIEAIRDYP
jgi:transposase